MNKWKDVTGYSRGESKATPRSWELTLGRLRVVITRLHGHDPEQWYGGCHHLNIKDILLGEPGISADEAQELILVHIKKFLKEALSNVDKAI